jgi:hypothetical protein
VGRHAAAIRVAGVLHPSVASVAAAARCASRALPMFVGPPPPLVRARPAMGVWDWLTGKRPAPRATLPEPVAFLGGPGTFALVVGQSEITNPAPRRGR